MPAVGTTLGGISMPPHEIFAMSFKSAQPATIGQLIAASAVPRGSGQVLPAPEAKDNPEEREQIFTKV